LDEKNKEPERDEKKFQEARIRISNLTIGLTHLFSPVDAAGLLFGAGVGVLADGLGPQETKKYLQGLVDDFNHPEDGPWNKTHEA